mmetsp:Transcript_143706/g.358220  ORF Transcript_143706/g.358220 Transcript_143706/m.358220 type:complete len:757 (+) Transcript_143706:146-2416(+)
MAKRDSPLLDLAAAAKRFRSDDRGGGTLGNDPNLLTAVGQLLAAAASGSSGSGTQLASLLTSALSQASGGGGGGGGGGRTTGSDRHRSHGHEGSSYTRDKPLGKWDAVVIPGMCVGWLKGRQGGMIREIESRSGAVVDIDQSTKDLGHCTVNMHGDEESKRKAYGFVVAEMLKVADQPGSNMDCSAIGTKLSLNIDAKFVGWVKGPKGKVVQDITGRSNTRVDVDQSNIHNGTAVVNVYGTHENVVYAKELIAHELNKVSPEAAADITHQAAWLASSVSSGYTASQVSSHNSYGSSDGGAAHSALQIPASYVGWLKGRQGQMIRDIESRSGATVDIDQTTKDLGHCTVNIKGPEEQKKKAFGLIVAEVMKVSDQSGVPIDSSIGTIIEIPIDGKYVGWVKGPKGKVVQDITSRSSTRVDVDQNIDVGRAVIKVYGTYEGVQTAKDLIAFEISKVSPEAAAEITGGVPPVGPSGYPSAAVTNSDMSMFSQHPGSSSYSSAPIDQDGGTYNSLSMPSSYVGWIKGKQGAMVRDIEARSGAVVDIDQTTKELGHVTVNFRGGVEEKKKAYGLVVAEVVKVSDQGGNTFDCTSFGTKVEIRLDSKYVGWVKGPRGKVVQDISTRSSTRIDMDQSNDAFAVVKIFGTYEGVQAAREYLAYELSKVSPEAASEITGQQYNTYPAQSQQSLPPANLSSPGSSGSNPDLSNITSLLAQVINGGGGGGTDPALSNQQAAAAQLTQSYLQQLAAVAPNLVSGDPQS